ncbi:flavodoxin [Brucepastera parasyntrophica]|uniref:flavodoxin n=1 Tax=Brucepastera parasyntrophica TaxID=2880008 RepID=UPI002109E076|nr:flavodoxin [Brucepastera parasyntrophica]ULQ60432.1 flavodoxin [Brucepastera parasyntrophica]
MMKIKTMMCIMLLTLTGISGLFAQERDPRILVAYFSWSGNSRLIAAEIHRRVGGDLVEIEMVTPYSRTYNTCLDQSLRDLRAGIHPSLKTLETDVAGYDVVFLGYPTWWATIPMPVATFLESCDFTGKIIAPFNSHGGGRLGQTVSAIAKLCPSVKITQALSIHYGGGRTLGSDIDAWLTEIGMAR